MADTALPPGLDGIYLGGGYPELHAARLAANRGMLTAIYEWAAAGGVIYAECGGFIYLCRGLAAGDGVFHPLVGVFPSRVRMEPRRVALGYREVTLQRDSLLGPAGSRLRGHEFHHPARRPSRCRRRGAAVYRRRRYRQRLPVAGGGGRLLSSALWLSAAKRRRSGCRLPAPVRRAKNGRRRPPDPNF
ncbi:MAG: hypothetical protein U5J62_07905 [Desulfurivibrio sp.]|nr:hypothetical protein [Desulfurivibrio sp.]